MPFNTHLSKNEQTQSDGCDQSKGVPLVGMGVDWYFLKTQQAWQADDGHREKSNNDQRQKLHEKQWDDLTDQSCQAHICDGISHEETQAHGWGDQSDHQIEDDQNTVMGGVNSHANSDGM